MKRIIAYIAALLVLTFCLTGCGAKDEHIDSTMPTARPTVTPYDGMYSEPDMDDGIVDDGDGIIGNEKDDTITDNEDMPQTTTPATAKPASPKPSTMPEK